MKIQDKVWVVTGGGNGIGRELTLQLLQRGAKAVAILDLDRKGMDETVALSTQSEKITTHVVDISNRSDVEQVVKDVIKAHGVVDGLINNAGIVQPFVKTQDLEIEQMERVMNINFYGPLYLIKASLPHFLKRPTETHIVNVSSMAALVPIPGQVLYGCSKAAVKLLTEGLYSELADTNVRVSSVFPGAVDTKIAQHSNVQVSTEASNSNKFPALPADQAAVAILRGVEANHYRILVGNDAWFMDLYSRFRPLAAAKLIYNNMKDLLVHADG